MHREPCTDCITWLPCQRFVWPSIMGCALCAKRIVPANRTALQATPDPAPAIMDHCRILDELAVMRTAKSYLRVRCQAVVVAHGGRCQWSTGGRRPGYTCSPMACPGTDGGSRQANSKHKWSLAVLYPKHVVPTSRSPCLRSRERLPAMQNTIINVIVLPSQESWSYPVFTASRSAQ